MILRFGNPVVQRGVEKHPVIVVSITALNQTAKAVMDVLNQALCGLDVETATGPYGDAAQVGTHLVARRYHRPHQVSRLEAEGGFAPHEIPARKAILREPCTLIAAASRGLDTKYGLLPVLNGIDMPDTSRVEAGGFRHVEPLTIPLRPSAGTDFYV